MSVEPTHPYEILDVFADRPLEGNPLAVFAEGEQVPSRLMQAVARELNLSETAFILPGDGDCDAQLRIFTPTTELRFAGHPTLGCAFVVAARTGLTDVRLRPPAGIVPVHLERGDGQEITSGEMEQPIPTIELLPDADVAALLEALGVDERPELPVEAYTNGPTHVLVALADPDVVARLAPDQSRLGRLGNFGVSCFAPLGETASSTYKTRMFAPAFGVAEDPATGSAAGPIAAHLVRHGRLASGAELELRQGAEIGRPSLLRATATGSREAVTRVTVAGSAVLVARGHFRLG